MNITDIENKTKELNEQANQIRSEAQADEQQFQARMQARQRQLTAIAEQLLRLEGRKEQIEETNGANDEQPPE